ncbi:MAG TPA: hypothetical protein VG650_10560 [Mycobacteriales bacterium]|nr:hypothetical protein [Mycobacteriales bacterium]
MNRARCAFSLLATAVATSLVLAQPAFAATKGKATKSQSVGSASWGAAGATTNGSPTLGTPFVLNWSLITLLPTSQYFKVVNTGTLDLTGETYTSVASGGPTVALTACVGATWNAGLGTCAGSQVSLGQTGGGATTATTAIAAGASLSVRAQTTGLLSLGTFTTSITVATTRSQVRAGTTTNS